MEPTQELIDALYRDKVRSARRMTPEQKLAAGAELFDSVCQIMRAGILGQFPGIDEEGVQAQMARRLQFLHRQELVREQR
jgi:hypothetical protein